MSIVISGVNNNDKITASDGTIDLLSGVTYGSEITVPSLKLGNNIQLGNAGVVTATSFSGTTGTFGDFVDVGNNIQLGNAGVATATTFVGNLTGNVNNTGNLLFQIGGSEKVRINSNGQLGIGINPTHTLEILSGADHQNVVMVRGNDATTEYAGMGVYNGYAVFTGGGVGSTSAGIIFRTAATGNETERLRITSDGAVMINKTSSFGTVPLQVKGASSGLSDGGQIFDIGTADGSNGTRLAFGVSEDNFGWIRSYESGVGGRDIVFAASEEKMRISSSYAKIGINTSTFDTNGSQIKIEGRGTGTTSPAFLQIKGVGNGALHSYVDLIATSDSNAGSAYRGLGVVMHDEPTNVEWFSGRPYAGSDKFIISRKASPSYRTESGEVANQLIRISSEGYVTKPYHPSFCARHQSGSGFSGNIILLTRISNSWDVWNIGGHYSTSTGKFTVPVAGVYYFEGQLMTTGHSNGDNIQDMFSLESNRGRITYVRQRESYFSTSTNANGYYTNSLGSSAQLAAGDTVWLQRNSSQSWGYSNRYYSYFTGWLIG